MRRWVLAALGAVGVFPPAALADSIWERRDPRYAFLFQDNQARRIGDILTVTVSENTVANDSDARAMSRTSSTGGQISLFGFGSTSSNGGTPTPGNAAHGVVFPLPNTNINRSFNGSASLTVNRVFTDQLAVTVVDIMPNGNLVIEGYRSRVVAGEERVLRITGVVRQQDIGLGNLVGSSLVANFRISYLGRGPESRFVNQSLLGRAVNLIWP